MRMEAFWRRMIPCGVTILKINILSSRYNEAENVPRFAHDVGTPLSGPDCEPKMSPSRAVPAQSAIVVPCYYERGRLCVSESERFLDSDQQNSVLIFVDDDSRDQMTAVLERIRNGHQEMKCT
jgi:hypothetical protein